MSKRLQFFKIFWGSMPPDPPRNMAFSPHKIWTPTFKILAKSLLYSQCIYHGCWQTGINSSLKQRNIIFILLRHWKTRQVTKWWFIYSYGYISVNVINIVLKVFILTHKKTIEMTNTTLISLQLLSKVKKMYHSAFTYGCRDHLSRDIF